MGNRSADCEGLDEINGAPTTVPHQRFESEWPYLPIFSGPLNPEAVHSIPNRRPPVTNNGAAPGPEVRHSPRTPAALETSQHYLVIFTRDLQAVRDDIEKALFRVCNVLTTGLPPPGEILDGIARSCFGIREQIVEWGKLIHRHWSKAAETRAPGPPQAILDAWLHRVRDCLRELKQQLDEVLENAPGPHTFGLINLLESSHNRLLDLCREMSLHLMVLEGSLDIPASRRSDILREANVRASLLDFYDKAVRLVKTKAEREEEEEEEEEDKTQLDTKANTNGGTNVNTRFLKNAPRIKRRLGRLKIALRDMSFFLLRKNDLLRVPPETIGRISWMESIIGIILATTFSDCPITARLRIVPGSLSEDEVLALDSGSLRFELDQIKQIKEDLEQKMREDDRCIENQGTLSQRGGFDVTDIGRRLVLSLKKLRNKFIPSEFEEIDPDENRLDS